MAPFPRTCPMGQAPGHDGTRYARPCLPATVLTRVNLWLILRAPDAIGIEMPLGALVAPTTVADAP